MSIQNGEWVIISGVKKYFKKKIFPAAPIHLTLQQIGWEEPKIVSRAWLAGIILSIFGLWLGLN